MGKETPPLPLLNQVGEKPAPDLTSEVRSLAVAIRAVAIVFTILISYFIISLVLQVRYFDYTLERADGSRYLDLAELFLGSRLPLVILCVLLPVAAILILYWARNQQRTAYLTSLSGGGKMGEFIRALNWGRTPLGRIEKWPQSLRTTVNLCLDSNFPIAIAWGPKKVMIYNDGYRPICGTRHPEAMGGDFSKLWASAWPSMMEPFYKAMAGESVYLEDQQLFLNRNGYLEETFFAFSFSPIRDEQGQIRGILNPCIETTRSVLNERRTRALRDMNAAVASAKSVKEVFTLAADQLRAYQADVPFVLFYSVHPEKDALEFLCGTADTGVLPRLDLDGSHPAAQAAMEAMRTGGAARLENLSEFEGACNGPYKEPPVVALVLPIMAPGRSRASAVMFAAASPRLPLNEPYRTFFHLLASGITTAVANAAAYEEQRQKAETLAEIDQAKTIFFNNVSHELRTPLTLVLGPIADILASPPGTISEKERELASIAHRGGVRLLKLIDTLLDFARIEAGHVDAHFESLNLCEFTSDLASVFRSAMERAGLRFVVDCGPLDGPVDVDRAMWEKIVLNLLSNAFKFTLEGEIRVQLREGGTLPNRPGERSVELRISDTGAGIPKHEAAKIFQRFHRVRTSRARTFEGTGIGLALVQELVKAHGGTIFVESEEGKGSTFIVTIPAAARESAQPRRETPPVRTSARAGYVQEAWQWLPEPAEKTHAEEAALASHYADEPAARSGVESRQRVLVVDDNRDMREYLQRLLSSEFHVAVFAEGEAALRHAAQEPPDIVVTDIMMPGVDGMELVRRLRENPTTQHIPVMMLSARSGEESRVEGIRLGADDYLAKPFTAKELLARLRAQLELARVRREARERERGLLTEVQAARDQLEGVLASVVDAFTTLDSEFRFTYANDRVLADRGLREEQEILGRTFWEIYPELKDTPYEKAMRDVARSRSDTRLQFFQKRTGRWVETRIYPAPDGGISLLSIDITDRKLAEEKLARDRDELEKAFASAQRAREDAEAAARTKDYFLAMLSHELRTPLTPVLTAADWLIRRENLPPRFTEALEMILRNVELEARFIDDLLDITRITRGKFELSRAPVDVHEAVQRAIEVSQADLSAKSQTLTVNLRAERRSLSGDFTRLQQVFWNLLKNASKFTPANGTINVLSRNENGSIVVEVIDTGKGIEPEALKEIFEPFRQANDSITREFGGLGLGLAIAKATVEAHGGRISASSAGSGRGATFSVHLPIASDVEDSTTAAAK